MNQRDISLVEIPVALVVVAIVLVCAIRTFRTAGSVQRDSHLGNQATAYGLAKLHELEAYPASQIVEGRDSVINATGAGFSRTWTVTDKPLGKEVNVVVGWRTVDQPMNVGGDVYIGGGVHFNGGADGSVFHGNMKIARGSGLQSTFDEQVDFCINTYIQTPFKSQGGGIKFGQSGGTGFEGDIFIDTDPLMRGNPNLFNGNVIGGHANLILQGHDVVHSGSLDLSSVPAGKRYTIAALGIGAWGNVTGADLSAAYTAAKASGKLYRDFLFLEVNSPLNFVAAGGSNILRGKFAFQVSSQVSMNLNLPESDPTSVSLWHICTPGKVFGFGGPGLFRGYVNVSGTGSVVYQWGGGAEFQGAIHHVDATTGFQLNASSGPLRLVFSSGVFDELAPLGILVPPGGIPVMAAQQVKLVDRNIRTVRRSRYF